jgi:ribonuclease HI
MDKLLIYTDGGSRGNPGKSAIGIIFMEGGGKILLEYKESVGIGTNNRAEYLAIIKALGLAEKFRPSEAHIFSDSELVIRQLTGRYRVKNEGLIPLYQELKALEKKFPKVKYFHVRRTDPIIQRADFLVNSALDAK